MSFSARPSNHLTVLDGLRALSILLVLAAHMLPLGPKALRLNEAAGGMGMSLFFSLSGFLIASTLLRNSNILDFFVKRLTRIVPLAYAYTLIVFGLLYYDASALFWTASFLLNYFSQYMVDGLNNHFWSLCVEMQFYLSIGLIVLLGGRTGIWVVWPACLVVTLLRIYTGTYYSIETHLRVDEILAGACVATFYQILLPKCTTRKPYLLVLALAFWFVCSSPLSGWLQYMRPYAAASVVTATLCTSTPVVLAALNSRVMAYIAKVSYALYVIHPLTIYGWMNEGAVAQRYLVKRPISFVITFVIAHLSTFFWERPWQILATRWLRRRRELQPASKGEGRIQD